MAGDQGYATGVEMSDRMAADKAARPVDQALKRMDKQLVVLSEVITELSARLEPVRDMTPRPVEASTVADPGTGSSMQIRLNDLSDRFSVETQRLQSLIGELEI